MPMNQVLEKEITALKQQINDVLSEEAKRKEDNPLKYFVPTGKQEEYINLPSFIRMFSGSNASGKSCVGVNCIGNLCLGPQNEWFKGNPIFSRYRDKKIRGRIISTHTSVEENIIPELKKWLPKGSFTAYKSGKQFLSKWYIGNSYIDIMTFDQPIDEFESVTLDFAYFDEPPPEKVLNATLARLRFGGVIFITFTPLTLSAYLYDRFIEPFNEMGNTANVGCVFACMADSCKDHGIRGFMPHNDIERLIELYENAGEEVEARIYGKFMHLSGRIFKFFEPPVHIVDPFEIPPHWASIHTLDPHDRKNFACTWAAISPKGFLYFFDEDFSCDLMETYVNMVAGKEKGHPIITTRRLIDPNFGLKRSSRTGRTFREDLEAIAYDAGYTYSYDTPDDNIPLGHKTVNQYLYYDRDREISDSNKPKMYIFSDCRNVINSMLKYTYKESSARKEDDDGKSENVRQKWKDFADCVRYTLMSNPTFSEPKIVRRSIYAQAGR